MFSNHLDAIVASTASSAGHRLSLFFVAHFQISLCKLVVEHNIA